MHPYRTRFQKDIIAEFYPPLTRRRQKQDRVIIFCPGQPGSPGAGSKLEFWAKKGFWTFAFRYRGTWESGGRFLAKSPMEDVIDIIDELTKKKQITELFGHKRFALRPSHIFLFGISFGGPAALLASRDPRVAKAVCFSPVVDWRDHIRRGETNSWVERFTREAFGEAYRFSHRDWKKLDSGTFYNPMAHADKLDGRKILIIHAKDDDVVRFKPVEEFAKKTGAKLVPLKRGGHLPSAWFTKANFYKKISAFLKTRV